MNQAMTLRPGNLLIERQDCREALRRNELQALKLSETLGLSSCLATICDWETQLIGAGWITADECDEISIQAMEAWEDER